MEELQALSTKNPVSWEPTCPAEVRVQSDYSARLKAFVNCLDFDKDLLDPLLAGCPEKAAIMILHVIQLPSETLKRDLESYQDGDFSDPTTGAKALVFYRRHASLVKPQLTAEEFNFYESMCSFLSCVLREAGYPVNGDFS